MDAFSVSEPSRAGENGVSSHPNNIILTPINRNTNDDIQCRSAPGTIWPNTTATGLGKVNFHPFQFSLQLIGSSFSRETYAPMDITPKHIEKRRIALKYSRIRFDKFNWYKENPAPTQVEVVI